MAPLCGHGIVGRADVITFTAVNPSGRRVFAWMMAGIARRNIRES